MLPQRFIELGEGYGDVYELCELVTSNSNRFHQTFIFSSQHQSGQALSLCSCLRTSKGKRFYAHLYLQGRDYTEVDDDKPKRRLLFEEAVEGWSRTRLSSN